MKKSGLSLRLRMLDKLASSPTYMKISKASESREYTPEIEAAKTLQTPMASRVVAGILDNISPDKPEEKYGIVKYLKEKYPREYHSFSMDIMLESPTSRGGVSGEDAAVKIFNGFLTIRNQMFGFEKPYEKNNMFKNALDNVMRDVVALMSNLGQSQAVTAISDEYKKLENIKKKRIVEENAAEIMRGLEQIERADREKDDKIMRGLEKMERKETKMPSPKIKPTMPSSTIPPELLEQK
jgi:hypothetical protein